MCHLGFMLEFSAVGIGQLRRVAFVSSTWKVANLTKSTSPVPHCNQGPAGIFFWILAGLGRVLKKKVGQRVGSGRVEVLKDTLFTLGHISGLPKMSGISDKNIIMLQLLSSRASREW